MGGEDSSGRRSRPQRPRTSARCREERGRGRRRRRSGRGRRGQDAACVWNQNPKLSISRFLLLVRWDLGRKRIKRGRRGVGVALVRTRWPASDPGRGNMLPAWLYSWQRLKSTASIGLVVASWGQQERVNDRPLIKRRRIGTSLDTFLLKKIEIFVLNLT